MRMAVIKGAVVINVVEAAADWVSPDGTTAVQSDIAGPGWTYTALGFNSPHPTTSMQPTAAHLVDDAEQKQASFLATARTFNVAASGSAAVDILCDGTSNTQASLAMLALFGQTNPTGSKTWIDNEGVATVLTGAELISLATQVGNWITNTYAALAALMASITSSAPTVTTFAEVGAFVWPTS